MGASWEEVEAPKYPEGDTVPPDFTVPAATSYIWLVEPGGADEPNRLYVGVEPGGLFESDDGGDSFHLMRRSGTTRPTSTGSAPGAITPAAVPSWSIGATAAI